MKKQWLAGLLILVAFCCSFAAVQAEESDSSAKWDLTEYYKDDAAFDEAAKSFETEALPAFEKMISEFNGISSLLPILQKEDELNHMIDRLYNYPESKISLNAVDAAAINQKNTAFNLQQKFTIDDTTLTNKLLAQDDAFWKEALESEALAPYRRNLSLTKEKAAHTLSDSEENLLLPAVQAQTNINQTYSVLLYTDLPIGSVTDPDGKEVEASYTNYMSAMENSDRDYRKNFFESYLKSYKNMRNTFASNLNTYMTLSEGLAQAHHYDSLLDQVMSENELTPEIYQALIEGGEKITPLVERKNQIRQKALGLDQYYDYDSRVPLGKSESPKFTYQEAQNIVKKSLSVLGQDYVDDLDRAFQNKWIDAYPADNKDTGAFSGMCVELHPWVLMNFTDDFYSLDTMAHELGHAIHQYRSYQKQESYFAKNPTSLVSEVASITNEMLLFRYLNDHAKNDEEKLFYVTQELSTLNSTFFGQIEFADFELQAHEKITSGSALTADDLDQIYSNILHIYSPGITSSEGSEGYWAAVPHFYYNYYVYSYAMDNAIACYVADKISAGDETMLKAYKDFLAAGNSDTSVELFKSLGVDVTKPDYINALSERYTYLLDEEEKLLQ